MAYDEDLADRLRRALSEHPDLTERKMFGGIAFMLGGHMCCGVATEDVMLRVGPDAYEAALAEPHAREMDFTGKPMKGYVYVAPEGLASERDLKAWVEKAVRFVRTLPPK
jgi:TfoX/Sxy family transcriptional regulator of competence genes